MKTSLAEPTLFTPLEEKRPKPRLGFLGVGWIGRNRLEAVVQSGAAEIIAVADASLDLASNAARDFPRCRAMRSMDELLDADLDGIVIATPSALHADQAMTALGRGVPVFCQKPLGRDASETRRVIEAARAADQLLAVDLSYRFTSGAKKAHELCRDGELGEIYAADLVFHNAYGPDKPWFYDRALSGGGCVIDLGIHLVDLALWNLGFPKVVQVTSRLFSGGQPVPGRSHAVEDFAEARLDLENGATIRIACSWKLALGCDAAISASFFGTAGGVSFHNVNGSFYDFVTERFRGTQREIVENRPESWGGRAAVDWARRIARGERFSGEIETVASVADALDAVYANAARKVLV